MQEGCAPWGARACALLSLLGCSEARPAADASVLRPGVDAASAPAQLRGQPAQAVEPPKALRGPRLKSLVGVLDGAPELQAGELIAANRVLELKTGAALTLDFAQGTRLVLRGPARALVAPRGEQALLLHSGVAEVDLPPSAPTPESGFWLASPSMRLELVRGGKLVVRAFADGASALFVVAGGAQLVAAQAPRSMPSFVAPGYQLRVAADGNVERAKVERLTLEAAVARSVAMGGPPAKPKRAVAVLDESLTRLVEELVAEVERERSLVAAHRERIGTPQALPAQAALAAQAGDLARKRTRLRALLSQRAAAHLALQPDDALERRAQELLR